MMIFLIVATLLYITHVAAQCDRDFLTGSVNSYLLAQRVGHTEGFKARLDTANFTYLENSKTLSIDVGLLNQALNHIHNRSIIDTTACATFTEVVVNSTIKPYVIGTQLRFARGKIQKVDSVVTEPGDWLFNVTGYQYWTTNETWSTINATDRDTRDTIQKAADAYLDRFMDPNVVVPWGTPCARLEGGSYGDPGPNGTCNVDVPTGVALTNRRYVVDEDLGSVDVLLDFGVGQWPDSHQFRIEHGKIRYIHTMSHEQE